MKKDLKKTMEKSYTKDEFVVRHYLTNAIREIMNPGYKNQDTKENEIKIKVIAFKLDNEYYSYFNKIKSLNYWFSISETLRFIISSYLSVLNSDLEFETCFGKIPKGRKENAVCTKIPQSLLNKINDYSKKHEITRTLTIEKAIFWFYRNWSLKE